MSSPQVLQGSKAKAQDRIQHALPEAADATRPSPANHAQNQKTRRKTITLTSTIFVDESSPNEYSPLNPSTIYIDTLAPRIHGIVPGLHSPHSRPLTTASTPTSPTTLQRSAARRSHYPLPSPPGFLYPAPIVPAAAHAHAAAYAVAQNNNQNQYQNQYILGRMDYRIAYLPPGLKILLILVIAVMTCAVLWTAIVWLVNFPPGSWGWVVKWQEESKKKQKQKQKQKKKKSWNWQKDTGDGNRGGAETTEDKEIELQHCSATTTALDSRFSIGSGTNSSRTRSRVTSPENPYLALAPTFGLTRRTSSEWLHDRAAFFHSTSISASPAPPSPSPGLNSRSPSLSTLPSASNSPEAPLSAIDLAAMEAGTAPLTGFTRHTKTDSEESILLKWFGEGLGMVDGAVDMVVDRVVRWTDDGGEEPLLLPVVERERRVT